MMFGKFLILILCSSLVLTTPCMASAAPNGGTTDSQMSTGGTKRQLTNIILAGLAGAVLGLSTLSFYGRPQDKLSNIALGAAFGVIVGTIYSTYEAAAEPRRFYGLTDEKFEPWLVTENRFDRRDFTPQAGWTISF